MLTQVSIRLFLYVKHVTKYRQIKMVLMPHRKWNNWQITKIETLDPPQWQVRSAMPWCVIFFFQTDNVKGHWKKGSKKTIEVHYLFLMKADGVKCSYLGKRKEMLKGCHHSNPITSPWTKYPSCGCLNKLKHFVHNVIISSSVCMDANCVTNRSLNGQFQLYISHPSYFSHWFSFGQIFHLFLCFHSPSETC